MFGKKRFSLFVERPPVKLFSSSVVLSVGYGVFPSMQELRSFRRKTGYFFNVSGTRDLITGENSKRVRKRQLRSSPLLSLTLRSATAQGAPMASAYMRIDNHPYVVRRT